ncbi:Adenylate and Guanylate cyclase catalytic domain containing protein [Tritrichomonas foetus]|uniref:Adenylate and Guanylate cyclase catalytic domain containing protein n=1 Tax=Tritrichomonas foetus TaxID=1144522 RepID=A0A1J4J6U6_9EUKA|nr:Adenylate and Guanylate cyclase catalytic domain containing protein [Tritrichomonas foetus]|eukprot:OHS94912.1 Adenylate and Guanylate cyclase catalytic domain containing protein [Tritrichomonas foetus]
MQSNQQNPPSSVMSKSTSSNDRMRFDIIKASSTKLDAIFPLLDEILKYVSIPDTISYIIIFIEVCQLYSMVVWNAFYYIAAFADTPLGKFYNLFTSIALFMPDREYTITFTTIAVLFILSLLFFVIQAISFSKSRRFVRWTLYVGKIILEFIPRCFLMPLASLLGRLFLIITGDESSPKYVAFFVISCIFYISMIIVLYVIDSFMAISPYLSSSPIASLNSTIHFTITSASSVFILLSYVFQLYGSWLDTLLVILHVIFQVYIIFRLFYAPFTRIKMNSFLCSILTADIICDFLMIYEVNGKALSYTPYFVVQVASLVVFNIVYGLIMTNMAKKARHNLFYKTMIGDDLEGKEGPPSSMVNDEMRKQWYADLKIDKFMLNCFYYLHIGLLNHSDLFIDFSLIKFAAEVYDNNKDLVCFIIQILTLFPSESRLMNFFFSIAIQKSGLTFAQRFLLYEVHKIISVRQSSASIEINDRLVEMKHITAKGINGSRGFWSNMPNSPDIFYQLRTFTERGIALFNESIEKWPNNIRLSEEYQVFLIECGTDFIEGVKMKHRADLIEQGKNFVIDHSFRSLIHVVPEYLKKDIVNVKGHFISKNKLTNATQTSGSSGSNNSSMTTGTIDGDLDVEVEETLSKQLFSMHRLRLAFQRALHTRRSSYSSALKLMSLFASVLLIAILVFLYVFYYNRYNIMKDSMERQFVFNNVRYGIDAGIVNLAYYWIDAYNMYDAELLEQLNAPSTMSNDHNIRFYADTLEEIIRWESYAKTNLETYLSSVLDLAATGVNALTFASPLATKNTTFNFCVEDNRTNEAVQQTLKVSLIFMIMRLRELTKISKGVRPDGTKFNHNHLVCELFSNLLYVIDQFDYMEDLMGIDIKNTSDSYSKMNIIIAIVVTIAYAVLTCPILLFFTYKYYNELKFMLNLMKNLDEQTRKDAAKTFKYESDSLDDHTNETLSKRRIQPEIITISIIFSLIVGLVLMVIIILVADQQNTQFYEMNEWLYQGAQRANHIFETVVYATFAISFRYPEFQSNIGNTSTSVTKGRITLEKLTVSNDNLLKGSDKIPPCVDFNEEIDNIHFTESCTEEPIYNNFHDNYRCTSVEKSITIFTTLATDILRSPEQYNFTANSSYYHLVHIANNHLIDPLFTVSTLLSQNADDAIAKLRLILVILLIVGIAYSVFGTLIINFYISKLDNAYKGGLQLLRRVPPIACTSNHSLMNYLLNKKAEKNDDKMTASKSVIFMSHDSVLCLNKNESIEVVNHAVTDLFGYTPEQLLGQNISCVLPEETSQNVFHQLQLMRHGQCSMIYETDAIGKSDDDNTIPVHVTVLGIAENGVAKSFAIVLRDQTELQRHKQEAEAAKAQSEHLLFQILPRDIVTRLNQGETDISFSVPSATIIFVDIVRWSDYSSTLSPAQIMSNLSIIFAKFDAAAAKYNLMTKIKLIGDVYMAAAGLFTPDEPPQNHASQVVHFGLDALTALDEANSVLESNLQVRIGVNTDGPLIAGVLGTDKPTFDIIGDPINVSSRLQSTCIPMTVQISHTTYELINDMSFNIEQRGEIELKGKGKRMAYIVRPIQNGSFFLQSDRDIMPLEHSIKLEEPP